MPNSYSDITNSTVNQNGCTYSNLTSTYSGKYANGMMADQTMYTVPALCPNGPSDLAYPPAYNTLQHGSGRATCGGYFSMSGAYPAANCTSCKATYVQRPCAGNIAGVCNAPMAVEGFCHKCQ